jgi:hypothetical protein
MPVIRCACSQMEDIETLNYDDLSSVAKLSSDQNYKDVMQVRSLQVAR